MADGADNEDPRGLFDDFGAFRTPTTADLTTVLTDGLVAPDANVLLNLYRHAEQARTDLLDALGALGDRLWVPHQALVGFWRNRETTISDARSTSAKAAQEVTAHAQQAVQALRTWANRVALSDKEIEQLRDRLNGTFDEVRRRITEVGEGESQHISHDTSADPVITRLEQVLARRVGRPFTTEETAGLLALGRRRAGERVPPGPNPVPTLDLR
ncbi:PIN-like domain-containing protein [Streptomyces monomycini]|uniref:PIN-like domain-containing protein n=1 Tax=Streptomyces monomycini TaxID=371720 RepID=UPI00067CCAA5|nr:PIN-like domain-containing protein [Streptomyces monomycini]